MDGPIFIRPMPTPNPSTIKFLVNRQLLPFGGRDFPTPAAAQGSPLAERLFALDGVGGVFVGTDFISITETPETDWTRLGDEVMRALTEHLESGQPLVAAEEKRSDGHDDEVISRIIRILDTEIRQAVAGDGGDVQFVAFEDGVVYLRLVGACAGCPSSTATLRMGIEGRLREEIPEIEAVMPA